MNEVEELEKKLAIAKREKQQQKWDEYIKKLEVFLERLKGQVLMAWTSNGNFYMFKVIDYKPCYYMDMQGAYGQWSPKRWFEIETSGYLTLRVPDCEGKTYESISLKIDEHSWFKDLHIPYGCTRLIKVKGKHKNSLIFPQFNFVGESKYSGSSEFKRVLTIGKIAFDKDIPDYDETLKNFCGFCKPIKSEIFDAAFEIYKKHVTDVLNFYKFFETDLKTNPSKYVLDEFNSLKIENEKL